MILTKEKFKNIANTVIDWLGIKTIHRIDNKYALAPILIFALSVLFSSICMMLNVSIVLSLLFAIAVVIIIGIKFDHTILISCMITIFVSLFCIVIAGHVYDVSYDGMSFHKEAVYALAKGWNPWRLSFWYYNSFGRIQDIALWLDNYPKGVWSFYACIYALLGKIEYAKGANIVFVMMLFFTACDTLYSVFNKKGWLLFFLSAIFTANTVIASQFFTYMNDLPVASVVMICAFLGMKIYADKADKVDYICLAAVFSSSFAIKFTAPVFCGLTLLSFGIAVAIKNKGKRLVKPCVIVIASAAIGFSVMGADPYIKHLAQGKNPFYPVAGEGSYDIMNTNAPGNIDDMSNVTALLTSIFSRSSPLPEDEPVIKIPFGIDKFELWGVSFGVWFSGILILSVICGIYALFKAKGVMPAIPALVIFILLAIFFPESWWARYNPYIYYIPPLLILMFSCADKTKSITIFMCIIMLLNSAFSGALVLRKYYKQTKILKWKIHELNKKKQHIYFNINDFPCHEIWFNEHDMDFEVVWDFGGEKGKNFFMTTEYMLESERKD